MLRTDLPKIITETVPGPKAKEMIERRKNATPSAIGCAYPVVIKRGEGAIIEDVDGNKFLDWIGGVGVLNIGFSQPEVIEAVKEQADQYFHGMFNIVTHEGYVALAEKLSEIAPVKGTKKKAVFEQCAPADTIAAIVVEPLQGEGGFIPAPIEWVKAVREICAIESSLSPKGNSYTRMFGYQAIGMILKGYLKIRDSGPEARKPLMKEFLLASNYAMFTGVMKNYMELRQDGEIAVLNQYIADILGCEVSDVCEELEKLLNVLIPKKALHEYGMTEEELDEFTDSVLENQQRLLANNFVPFDRERIYKIYRELY